ncbi:MAG: hypothetical protein WAZ34_12860 [Rhodocyclaceae bacterium]
MTTISFDTLQFVQRLRKAGINEGEAEAIAEAVRDVQDSADVATKYDLALVQQDIAGLRKDVAVIKAELEVKIAETKGELVRWVVGVGMLQTAMIAALLMKLIPS